MALHGAAIFGDAFAGVRPPPLPGFPLPAIEPQVAITLWLVAALVTAALAAIQYRMQRHLVSTDRDHRQLLETANDMVMTFDPDGRITSVNSAVERMSGYTRAELLGRNYRQLLHPDDAAPVIERLAGLAPDTPAHYDVRGWAKDGSTRVAACTTSLVLDPRGRITGSVMIARDVTAEREREAALLASEARFRLLVGALDDTFVLLDAELRFTAIHGRWHGLLIPPADPVQGRPLRDAYPEPYASYYESQLKRALVGHRVEFESVVEQGDRRTVFRIAASPVRGPAGVVHGLAVVISDRTQQKAAERERDALRMKLEDARRMEEIGKLVSGVAHELNNPLAAILNFTEVLLGEARDAGDHAALETVYAQALRSRAIVRDLLAFARQGQQRPFARLDAARLAAGVARAQEPALRHLGVTLRTAITPHTQPLDGDVAGLEQVLTNLVTNAAQAAGHGGVVELDAAPVDDGYEFRVRDTGAGFDDAALARLGEPFFTTKASGEGTGLGLYVTRAIVQRHGGEIAFANRADRSGAEVIVRLPFAVSAVTAAPRASGPVAVAADPPTDGSAPRVLLVDDEEPIRSSLRRFFEKRGWAVDEAPNGQLAYDAIAAGGPDRYDAIVCDLRMPVMSGIELYRRLTRERSPAVERVILSTGDVASSEVRAFLAGTRAPLLEKPFELRALGQLTDRMRRDAETTPVGVA